MLKFKKFTEERLSLFCASAMLVLNAQNKGNKGPLFGA